MSWHRWISATILVVVLLTTATNAHILSATEESEVRVIPNPHSCNQKPLTSTSPDASYSASSSSCEPSLLLSPHRIIRTPMVTQPDTLVEITHKKVLSVPVPVYHFRQPSRISDLELPFRLVLVSDIDAAPHLLREIPVPHSVAVDSWFPGYVWSPVVYSGCSDDGNGPVHVGWKFTNPTSGEFFYALIIDAKDDEKSGVRFGLVGALGEMIAVGTQAPSWMMDMLTNI
mmetsp:Transcript_3688/g.8068  ORF Transcript_3688/g.8068 Transcript_3688/m.8068 type:complete len:229 (+) Transcript_3688:130-816(+)